MKKAERIEELHCGQKIYAGEGREKKEYIVRSVEKKLVPYVIATDNSCHSIRQGIWIGE